MSPILVRPVREQFEHDRVIRVLQAKYKRKFEVAINPGAEQNQAVGVGELMMYPDLVLLSQEPRNRRIHGTIEVETTESINSLEAMAEWGPFGRLKTPFFLYVPANSIDTARRLCSDLGVEPAEIWTYHTAMDQIRFTMVHRSASAPTGTIAAPKVKPAVPPPMPEPEPEPEPVAPEPVPARSVRGQAPRPAKAEVAAKGAKASPPPAAPAKRPAPIAVAPRAAAKSTASRPEPTRGAAKSAKAAASKTSGRANGAPKAKKVAPPAKAVRSAKAVKAKTTTKSAKGARSSKSAAAARRR